MAELSEIGVPGLLPVHVVGFRGALAGLSYSQRTARDHRYVLAQASAG